MGRKPYLTGLVRDVGDWVHDQGKANEVGSRN